MTQHPLNKKGLTLSNEQALGLQISAFSDFMDVAGSLYGGLAQQRAYKFEASQANQNADILRLNAKDILQASYDYENKVRMEGMRTRAAQRTAMSASGFDVNSVSYQKVIGQTDANIARNTAAIRREAMIKYGATQAKASILDSQARLYRRGGEAALFGGFAEGLTSGLTGALKLSMLNKYGSKK